MASHSTSEAGAAPDPRALGPTLSSDVLAFCQTLRRLGFSVGPREAGDALEALAATDLGRYETFRDALSVVLCSRREQSDRFDALVRAHFFPASRGSLPPPAKLPGPTARPGGEGAGGPEARAKAAPTGSASTSDDSVQTPAAVRVEGEADDSDGADGAPGAAMRAAFGSQIAAAPAPPDLAHDALPVLIPAVDRLLARLARGKRRRWRPASNGRRIHMRRTLRRAVQTGGEVMRPALRSRRPRDPRYVLLLDASRSMEAASRLTLQFGEALARRARRVEVFLFSTELARVTAPFRQTRRTGTRPDLARLARAGELDGAWGGGTRIGTSLEDFVRRYGRRLLGRDTVVFIASDGLDTDDPEVLGEAMRGLARRSAALVWLNPLLASEGYEPIAGGMQAALPYVDTFAPAGHAEDFRVLAERVRLVR